MLLCIWQKGGLKLSKKFKEVTRKKNFVIRVTDDEEQNIKKLANEKGMSVSAFLRAKALGVI